MKILKLTLFILCVCFAGAAFADNGNETKVYDTKDTEYYSPDSTIEVYLDFQSFVKYGFTIDFVDINQASLENVTRRTVDQWNNSSAVRLKLVYKGLWPEDGLSGITKSAFVIRARHMDSVVARWNPLWEIKPLSGTLTFYRYAADEYGRPAKRDWSAFTGEHHRFSISGILMHEMGHALGLGHNLNTNAKSGEINTLATVMTWEKSFRFPHGPYNEDVEDLRDIYSVRDPLRLKVLRSTDGGKSWVARETNLQDHYINSHLPMSMVRDADRMVLAYTTVDNHPGFILSDDTGRQWSYNIPFMEESSLYGTAVGGYDDEYMLAWVTNDAKSKVRAKFTKNGGVTWTSCSPPATDFQSRASGTPAINKVSGSTWMLAYPKMESDVRDYHGTVVVRISGDDCKTWSDEFVVFSGEHALDGVSIASKGKNEIMLAFANADYDVGTVGNIVTLTLSIDSQDQIKNENYSIESSSISTLSTPSIALSSERWLMAYRTPDGKIRTRTKNEFENAWGNMQKPIDQVGYTIYPCQSLR